MMRVKCDRALIIKNGFTEILEAEPSIAKIVEEVCTPVAGFDERLIRVNRFLEMPFTVFLVGLGKLSRYVGVHRLGHHGDECNPERQFDGPFHSLKLSIKSKTSVRVSAGTETPFGRPPL